MLLRSPFRSTLEVRTVFITSLYQLFYLHCIISCPNTKFIVTIYSACPSPPIWNQTQKLCRSCLEETGNCLRHKRDEVSHVTLTLPFWGEKSEAKMYFCCQEKRRYMCKLNKDSQMLSTYCSFVEWTKRDTSVENPG